MSDSSKKGLYIPQGLKVENEIFTGFGKKEMIRALVICFILTVINTLILLIVRNALVFVVMMLASITASVMATQKDQSNVSIYDQIKFMIRFSKGQKYYPYKYLPEWGEEIEKQK
ncbi:hypothetical protein [Alkaliphilus oremlandii]|uniref:PrgI family protein n=1 Tax=Alkaliphilus oremlandii (strain OhILAs) TaxID=350688 RepID=A8MI17_ALKOO|nr:hypothetical protein [Alkaliphilus oremlandii]ABW19449.1 hypothetical protein Clos_1909 [Alkaliphilus oremlandii OhILAs]